jgi:hypothetical protein
MVAVPRDLLQDPATRVVGGAVGNQLPAAGEHCSVTFVKEAESLVRVLSSLI